MAMCAELNGSVYFSGAGAKGYQEGMELPGGMKIVYQDLWKYLDRIKNPKFVNGLSILDALFFIGPEQIVELFRNYDDPNNQLIFIE